MVAQRLVRCICPHCKAAYTPSQEELAELGLKKAQLSLEKLFKGTGCGHCFETGYKGRYGVYELMPMNSRLKSQVLKSQDAEELRRVALSQDMTSLFDHGIQLVIEGITTSAELLRVTRIDAKEA